MTVALAGLGALFVLLLLRMPIAFAMGLVGTIGIALERGWTPAAATAAAMTYEAGFTYSFSVVPMFILMGNFVARSGISDELYEIARSFIGHRRGGLAIATITACAGFGAVCGSSIATAATMTKVAYPPMRASRYSDKLAASAIAAGGTLGIIIPPSTVLVLYGLLTETNIRTLFIAAIIPGIIATLLLCLAVMVVTYFDPAAGPAGERVPWAKRLKALNGLGFLAVLAVIIGAGGWFGIIPTASLGIVAALAIFVLALFSPGIVNVIALFALVVGGIYGGVFTPTEAAGVGAAGAFAFSMGRRTLTLRDFWDVLSETARTTAMIFTILIGAMIFANFINYTSMAADITGVIVDLNLGPVAVIGIICLIYLLLGSIMEELSMVFLTLPIFFPIVTQMGVDPVWFGILIVVVVEIGLISPPVGMNLFVVQTSLPHISTGTMFRGVIPFVAADLVRLALLILFPALSLYLPSTVN
ncbi:TRAP transporter large permease [Aquibium sp. LZ166]|uniref:TRAP transporter large permease n=1 Tax=Aquibium pacificus TaxID=3153579 RepID=A0ABV3SLS1_9HYPH